MRGTVGNGRTLRGDAPTYKGLAGGIIILSIALGPLRLGIFGIQSKLIYASQAVTLVYIAARIFGPSSTVRLRNKGIYTVLIASMTPALIVAPVFRSAVVAYSNFAVGVLAALVVATGFGQAGSGEYIYRAFYWIPVITATQLIFSLRKATNLSDLHQNAHISWGASNYVAALIVVWVTITIPHLLMERSPKYYYIPQAFAVAVALLTLSRGATVAAAVGVAAVIWWATRASTWKLALRAVVTFVPLGAVLAVGYIGHLRSAQNQNAAVNVTSRFSLYHIALHDFESSPIFGHGWVSLRSESAASIGQQESFAHNFFASFLQMGGLMALPVILLVLFATLRLCRAASPLFPAALAGLAISMSDPFFEGFVGALTMFGILIGGLVAYPRGNSDHFHGDSRALPGLRHGVQERGVPASAHR